MNETTNQTMCGCGVPGCSGTAPYTTPAPVVILGATPGALSIPEQRLAS